MATSAPRTASSKPAEGSTRPLAGRHAVITGGSRGIGAAIARELARLGADISLIARNQAALAETARSLKVAGTRVQDIAADITDEAKAAQAMADAAAGLGAPAILINNAGGAESAPFARTDPALWRRMIELNLTGAYLCTRAVAPAMTAAGWGRIVNVASTAGLKGYAYVSAYVAAKHGLIGLTRALAIEFARTGVTVNAVCPGYTDTPMLDGAIEKIAAKTKRSADDARASLAASNPMGRLITPDEVAAAIGYLCLPAAGSVTGATLTVDGGEAA